MVGLLYKANLGCQLENVFVRLVVIGT